MGRKTKNTRCTRCGSAIKPPKEEAGSTPHQLCVGCLFHTDRDHFLKERSELTCSPCRSLADRTFAENRRRSLASILNESAVLMTAIEAKQFNAERERNGHPSLIRMFKEGLPPFGEETDDSVEESREGTPDRGLEPNARLSVPETDSDSVASNVPRAQDDGLYTPDSSPAKVVVDPSIAGSTIVSIVQSNRGGRGLVGLGPRVVPLLSVLLRGPHHQKWICQPWGHAWRPA